MVEVWIQFCSYCDFEIIWATIVNSKPYDDPQALKTGTSELLVLKLMAFPKSLYLRESGKC